VGFIDKRDSPFTVLLAVYAMFSKQLLRQVLAIAGIRFTPDDLAAMVAIEQPTTTLTSSGCSTHRVRATHRSPTPRSHTFVPYQVSTRTAESQLLPSPASTHA
jgi:hypothetical protein